MDKLGIWKLAVLGGNVRVDLEDSLTIDAGTLASSNAQQVSRIRQINLFQSIRVSLHLACLQITA